MASPPNIQALNLDGISAPLVLHNADGQLQPNIAGFPSSSSSTNAGTPTCISVLSPEGIDCYGDEKQCLMDQAKYFNNPTLSDVILVVGGSKFFAHKLMLVRSSDVFERMLSDQWHSSQSKVLFIK